jgi:hypothetical protein
MSDSSQIVRLIVAALVIYVIFTMKESRDTQARVGNYTTKYFPLSGGYSLEMFNTMKDNNVSESSLKEFLSMEDAFLKMEYDTVRGGMSYHIQGQELSKMIKERFRGFTFDYHNLHIKQMAEPSKTVNTNLV